MGTGESKLYWVEDFGEVDGLVKCLGLAVHEYAELMLVADIASLNIYRKTPYKVIFVKNTIPIKELACKGFKIEDFHCCGAVKERGGGSYIE